MPIYSSGLSSRKNRLGKPIASETGSLENMFSPIVPNLDSECGSRIFQAHDARAFHSHVCLVAVGSNGVRGASKLHLLHLRSLVSSCCRRRSEDTARIREWQGWFQAHAGWTPHDQCNCQRERERRLGRLPRSNDADGVAACSERGSKKPPLICC